MFAMKPIVITHSSSKKAPATHTLPSPREPFVFEKKEVKPPEPKASSLTDLVAFTRRTHYVTYLH